LLSLSTVAHADTLQLFGEQVAIGQPFGLQLCDIRCIQTPYGAPDILEQVSFVDTGVPQSEFFAASDPNVNQLIAYLLDPAAGTGATSNIFIRTIADSNYFAGHLDDYPTEGNSVITGMLFQLNANGIATYSVTGDNLVPEAGTMLLTLMVIMGVLAVAVAKPMGAQRHNPSAL
jgi:hypothetical protein